MVSSELEKSDAIYVGTPVKCIRENIVWGRNPKNVPWDLY